MIKEHTIIPYASFWQRLLAHNIDLLPVLGLYYLSSLTPFEISDFWLLGCIYVFYHTLFELSPWHATPGKRWIGLHVENLGSGAVEPARIVLRNCCKILSLILFFGGFVMIIFHPKNQGLHDYIGGTLVLFGEE